METTIYLIRHSEQLKNKAILKVDEPSQISNEKIILTISGEKKAEELSNLKEFSNIDVLWSSHYTRATATAKYIANKNNIPINIDSNFGERQLGNLDSLEEIAKTKKNSYTTEQLLNHNLKNLNGENLLEVRSRTMKSLNDILRDYAGKKIAIVSHGAAIKFTLLSWCKFNEISHNLEYENKITATENLNSPDIFKLTFNNNELIDLKHIQI